MDLAREYMYESDEPYDEIVVSILVLVDLAREYTITFRILVSILVLVDLARE